MDFRPFLEERDWTPIQRENGKTIYTRPLYGSELFWHQTHRFNEGQSEVVAGITLSTTVDKESLKAKILEALTYSRFVSPILASTVEIGVYEHDQPSWVYTAASSYAEAVSWAHSSLEVVEENHTPDSFIARCHRYRLPYVHKENGHTHEQHFRAFLVFDVDDNPGLALHGTHAVFDASPCLNFFYVLLSYLTDPALCAEGYIDGLAWGTEWRNLPPGPIISTGGPKSEWETKGMELLTVIQQNLVPPGRPLWLKSSRKEVKTPWASVRITEKVDSEMTTKLSERAKEMGYTVSVLLEAAHALAIFEVNPDVDPAEDVHVTSGGSYMNLFKYRVPPYNLRSQLIGALAKVPVVHPGSLVHAHPGDTRAQLLALMEHLRATYAGYSENPHLPAITSLAARLSPRMTAPSLGSVNSIGVVERAIPMRYRAEGAEGVEGVYEIDDVWFGHRMAPSHKLVVHFWTMKGEMRLMAQTNDAWDEEYLRAFLRRIVSIACSIL